jgi:hypothetical protein
MIKKRGQLAFTAKVEESEQQPVTTGKKSTVAATREGKTALPFWVPVSARQQLRIMAAEYDTTMQALLVEALNDFFKKHDKPPIA